MTQRTAKSLLEVSGLLFAVSVAACTDPPGDPVLIIDLIADNRRAQDITGLGFSPQRVELMVSETLDGEPSLVSVPGSSGKSLTLTFDAVGTAHDFISLYAPRAGFLHQVRFIEDSVAIFGPAAGSGTAAAKVPSGLQTGIKITPADGKPFELRRDRNTRIEVRFDVAHQVNRPKKTEFHFKPALTAVLREGPVDSVIPLDRVVIKFSSAVSESRIAQLLNERNMQVKARWRMNNYYVASLPSTTSMEAALHDLASLTEVELTLPDFAMRLGAAPSDPAWNSQTQFKQTNFDKAWDLTTGSSQPIVAVLDTGVDLDHRDLIDNMFLNTGEIPARVMALVKNVNGDAVTDWRDIDFNGDKDGVLTFIDLNSAANVTLGLCPRSNNAPADKCDPLDLVNGTTATNYGWQDGVDNDNPDGNGSFIDDLVGWNFESGNNLPIEAGAGPDFGPHGTQVAGVAGAVGNNGMDLAGASWRMRILPVRLSVSGKPTEFQPYRSSAILALNYAALLGADIINLSSGFYAATGPTPPLGCQSAGATGVPLEKLRAFRGELQKEFTTSIALRNSALVTIAHNCPYNLDEEGVFEWPASFKNSQVLVVGAADANGNLTGSSGRGSSVVDLAAPGEKFQTLFPGGGQSDVCFGHPGACGGTSLAAPMVAGALSLVLSRDPTGLRAQPCRLIDRVLRNAGNLNGPSGAVAGNRLLDADRAVRNVVQAGVRTCP